MEEQTGCGRLGVEESRWNEGSVHGIPDIGMGRHLGSTRRGWWGINKGAVNVGVEGESEY